MATLHEQRSVNNRQSETAFGETMHGGAGRPRHGRGVDLREPVGGKKSKPFLAVSLHDLVAGKEIINLGILRGDLTSSRAHGP